MTLRATKPDPKQTRLKLLLYGPAGVGKTTACCQFPAAYILDCERGTEHQQYADKIQAAGGVVFKCPDIHEAIKEVSALRSEKHDYQTLVIDSITVLYIDEADRQEKRVGTDYQKHRSEAQKPLRRLWALINGLDMNVLVTAHAKNQWENGQSTGRQTFDCWDKLEYRFDLVLELQRDKKKPDVRTATVRKTRLSEFPDGSTFPWSYQDVCKRYPAAASGQPAQAVTPATVAQVERLKGLILKVNLAPDTLDKWLAKAQVEAVEDMPADVIQKCIDHLLAV